MRNIFYYLFYFQMHQLLIDSKQVEEDLAQSIQENVEHMQSEADYEMSAINISVLEEPTPTEEHKYEQPMRR